MLRDALSTLPSTEDSLEALRRLAAGYRHFVLDNPGLAQVMFFRPYTDFDPTTAEREAGAEVRDLFVQRVRVAVDAGLFDGDPTDIAHIYFGVVEGLTAAECAQRLGTSKQSVNRRWKLGLNALFDGLQPTGS